MSALTGKPRETPRAKAIDGWRHYRLCWSLLLVMALLIAQHGSAVHALSHYFEPETESKSKSDKNSHNHHCQLCLAFAQINSGAAPEIAIPVFLPNSSVEPFTTAFSLVVVADLPSQRNRGPPALS
jgi:phenylpropionate dioxygenase-like ring-hydroxylating dioxygenase large terminal subunit